MTEAAPISALVADDSQTARSLLRRQIQQHAPGAKIEECADGADALERYLLTRPDIVFLDYNMPMMTGVDVLREIRRLDPNAFVVLVTSDRTPERVQEAKSLGVSGYIAKPYSSADILRVVERSRAAKERPLSVLLADDARTHRAIMARLLTSLGRPVCIEEAVDGEDACRRYCEARHDVIILDINMPRMNGLEALKAIRTRAPAAKVVVMSANRDEVIASQARQLGASAFLTKPITLETLRGAVLDRSDDDSILIG